MKSINQTFHTTTLSISQTQPVNKLIEKKDQDKRSIKNWRPISLLNVDTKVYLIKNCFAYVNFFTKNFLGKKHVY